MKEQTIYINNLPESYDSDTVSQLFSAYGKIARISYPLDKKNNRTKGYAFITYTNYEAAERALERNNQEIQGNTLIVEFSKNQTLADISKSPKTRKSKRSVQEK